MSYEIEKGVEMLPIYLRDNSRFPLVKMEVGDSFLVSLGEKRSLDSAVNRLRRKGAPMKFATRKINAEQARCWRIK